MTDLHKGYYRRIYAGFIWGRRINSVSLQAEAWFWRLLAVADDYGNLPADAPHLYALTSGRRSASREEVTAFCAELVQADLIRPYSSPSGDAFYHIAGFVGLQPAGKNGKRYAKCPIHPPEADATTGDASGCIRVNPSESSLAGTQQEQEQDQEQKQEQEQNNPPTPQGGAVVHPPAAKAPNAARKLTLTEALRHPTPMDWPTEMARLWADWLTVRCAETRKIPSRRALELALEDLEKWGHAKGLQALRDAVKGGWQGLHEPRGIPNGGVVPADRKAANAAQIDRVMKRVAQEARNG